MEPRSWLSCVLGRRATLTRTFRRDEVDAFGAFAFAADDGDRVPNALVGGLFSRLLGTELPGRGTNWMKQSLRFRRRARVGEPLVASVEIVRLRPRQAAREPARRAAPAATATWCARARRW